MISLEKLQDLIVSYAFSIFEVEKESGNFKPDDEDYFAEKFRDTATNQWDKPGYDIVTWIENYHPGNYYPPNLTTQILTSTTC